MRSIPRHPLESTGPRRLLTSPELSCSLPLLQQATTLEPQDWLASMGVVGYPRAPTEPEAAARTARERMAMKLFILKGRSVIGRIGLDVKAGGLRRRRSCRCWKMRMMNLGGSSIGFYRRCEVAVQERSASSKSPRRWSASLLGAAARLDGEMRPDTQWIRTAEFIFM